MHSLSCADGSLNFAAQNTFKQQNADRGYYSVRSSAGARLAEGSFGFEPHWAPANVTVDVTSSAVGDVKLTVTNVWGQNTTVEVECSDSSLAAAAAGPPQRHR